MATLTFNSESYTVDHAVKGADYIHGYDANGILIVAFDGISDFSAYSYDGSYVNPEACFDETCNIVKYINGKLLTNNGNAADLVDYLHSTGGTVNGSVTVSKSGACFVKVEDTSKSRDFGMVTSSGVCGLYDYNNSSWIVKNAADGTNTFNGKATGNGNPVSIGPSAPSDTSALWIDTSA